MRRRWVFVFLATVMIIGTCFPEIAKSASTQAKRINIAVLGEPTSPDASFDSSGVSGVVLENMYEYLIQKEINGKLTPGLAASWRISPDGKTIDFTLRKGVKFHSGDSLTSKDVVFTFERARAKNPWMKTKLRALDKVAVLDDLNVRFLFKSPDVIFLPDRTTTMIVSKSYYDRVGEDKFVKDPVGTGPYKCTDYQMGQYIDMERFEGYWGKKPSVEKARIYFVPEDTTRIAKLQAGEVDLIQGVPYNMVKMIESSSNLKAVKLETNWPNMSVMISNQNPNKPWYDKRVRLAMAYAIDCDSIIKHVLFGIPNRVPWLAPGDLGYDPTVKTYPYDPKRAKELLAEAGYPNGFELKLYWPTNWTAMSQEVVQAIASYFEAVGIRTKLEGQEFETFSATRRAGKQPTSDYVAYANGGLAGASDPTLNADTHFACQGGASTHCNPEFDKVLAEARTTVDDTQRAELIKRLVKILREEVSYIPIFSGMATYGMKKNIDYVPTRFFLDLVLVKNITVK